MKRYITFLILAQVFLALVSCTIQPTPITTPIIETAGETPKELVEAYPPPFPTRETPAGYPGPGESTSLQTSPEVPDDPLPSPDPTKGIVKGTIINNDQPYASTVIYLAEVIVDDHGNESVVGFDRVNSHKAVTNSQGMFNFINIPPGKYGLVIDLMINAYLLHYPDTNEQIIVFVEAGKETDLGDLSYDFLPNP